MQLPKEIGPIHFVGIGGIGMSGIAEVLINLGHSVQGSDASDNANVKRLREHGAKVFVGHDAQNLGDAAVVVVSTAIRRDNPELVAARAKRIPVVRRAEMLAELMRLKSCVAVAGTHGKTTTTSLVATLLDAAGLDPTVINGGIINAYGTNARLGGGDWMVVEADESDGTFLKLPADVAIVTNIDPEHLDHFKTFEAIKDAFRALIENLPFYGFAVMCLDHPTVQEMVGKIEDRRVFTYGENPQADIRLLDVEMGGGVTRFAVLIRERATGRATYIDNLALPMPGRHNALNATAAIAVAHRLGASVEVIRKAIAGFGGVKRRFTRTGDWNGVTIYDDYGHHPVEIAAVLKAARDATPGKVIAIVQPHRFSRLASLFDAFATCFNDADTVLVADVYPAGEAPIEGADKAHLAAAIGAHGHRHAVALTGPEAIAPAVRELATPGDIVVFLGAGTVTQWAYALPAELAALDGEALMPKTAIAIRHVAFEDVGVWRDTLAEHGYALAYVEAGVGDLPVEAVLAADLVIALGGPIGVYETDAYPFLTEEIAVIRRRLEAQEPTLGVCLGAQLMAAALGARVAPGPGKEIGYGPVELTDAGRASPLARLEGLPVLHWHGDNCGLPAGAERLASTALCPVQAFRVGSAALGLQFHVEADPRRIETWLIGHAVELGKANIDPQIVRADAERLGAATAAAGRAILSDWLEAQPR